jgi:hypothetical protein
MTDAVIFVATMLTLAVAVLAGLYGLVGNAPVQSERPSYRRHRPWNFK